MGVENSDDLHSRRLTSWKEIAAFLGRDERTAKRWEASRGLPVRRLPGSGRAAVFAYVHELQAWLDGHAAPELADTPPEIIAPVAAPHATGWPVAWTIAAAVAVIAVVAAIVVASVPPRTAAPREAGTYRPANPVALEYYRSGLHAWQTRSPSGLLRAIEDFKAAGRLDPKYAGAYVGLANAYNLLCEYTSTACGTAYAQARAAAEHAIALDPALAGAHAALAFDDFYERHDEAGARREFVRAIALDPRDPAFHHWYATFLMTIGDFVAARGEIQKASELDSESVAILADKALILFYAGDARQAVRLLKQIEADQPPFASSHNYLAFIDLMQGDDSGYLEELKLFAQSRHDSRGAALAAAGHDGLQANGHLGMLNGLLNESLAFYAKGQEPAYSVAQYFALLGDRQKALSYLAIGFTRREPEMIGIRIDPMLVSLHDMPEFQRLVARAGFRQPEDKRNR
jgi:hypothetical protein